MIFQLDKNNPLSKYNTLFNGQLNFNPTDWHSNIPSFDIRENGGFDPALLSDINSLIGTEFQQQIEFATKYFRNIASAAQIAIGQVSTNYGFLVGDFVNIANVFSSPSGDLGLDIVNGINVIVNSQLFKAGLDAIGAIPIVGWIIDAVVTIAQIVISIVRKIQAKKDKELQKEIISHNSVPIANFDPELDELLVRSLLTNIKSGDIEKIFSPRYIYANTKGNVNLLKFKINDEKLNTNDFPLFYNISGTDNKSIGFVPGTTSMFGAMRFSIRSGSVSNTGDFFPTVNGTGLSIFEMLQKPGPLLFSINPDKVSDLWKTQIRQILEYADISIRTGWTKYVTGWPNREEISEINKFSCIKYIENKGIKGIKDYSTFEKIFKDASKKSNGMFVECGKKSTKGDKLYTIPTGHYAVFRQDMANRFFDGALKTTSTGKYDTDYIDYEKSIPALALENTKNIQFAIINSLNCCYVNDDPKFAAFSNKSLKNKWINNINAVLDSNEWKKLVFIDIPEGEFKNEVRAKAIAGKFKNFETKKEPISGVGIQTIKLAPSILGDPKPPAPFNPVKPKRVGRKKQIVSKSSNSSLLTGAAVVGVSYFFLNKSN